MPFLEIIPRPLTSGAVRAYAPMASGVYGISSASEWVYIGEADNIQGALQRHLSDSDSSVMKREPTGFVYEICEAPERLVRHRSLVMEYNPACNRQAARYPAASDRRRELV